MLKIIICPTVPVFERCLPARKAIGKTTATLMKAATTDVQIEPQDADKIFSKSTRMISMAKY